MSDLLRHHKRELYLGYSGPRLSGAVRERADKRRVDAETRGPVFDRDQRHIIAYHTALGRYGCVTELPLGDMGSPEEFEILGPKGSEPQSSSEALRLGRLAAQLCPHE